MSKYRVHGTSGIVTIEATGADAAADQYTHRLGGEVYYVEVVG